MSSGVRYVWSSWHRGLVGGESFQIVVVNGGLTAGRAVGGTLASTYSRREVAVVGGTDTASDLTCFGSTAYGDGVYP